MKDLAQLIFSELELHGIDVTLAINELLYTTNNLI